MSSAWDRITESDRIASHEVRTLELLESIRTGVSILWAVTVGTLPWDPTWYNILMKIIFWTAGWIAIHWAPIQRWWRRTRGWWRSRRKSRA